MTARHADEYDDDDDLRISPPVGLPTWQFRGSPAPATKSRAQGVAHIVVPAAVRGDLRTRWRTRRTRRRRGGSRVVPSWGAARPSGSRPGRGRPRVLTKGSARCSAAGSITTSGASCSSGRLERLRGGAASGAHPRNALGEAQPSERTTRAKARRDST
ncbi:unnamed protein product, partial [Prorocentrum cordatum]